jgi:hypothetical protein
LNVRFTFAADSGLLRDASLGGASFVFLTPVNGRAVGRDRVEGRAAFLNIGVLRKIDVKLAKEGGF